MINTMENFDIYDAEDYFISFKSFKGTDILEWIKTHLDSDITDEKIFAKFLKKKYIKNGKFTPHKDQYYYFKRVGEMEYYLIRDKVMSPLINEFEPSNVSIKEFKKLLSNIRSLEKKIKRFSDKQDLIKIQDLNDILDWRIETIMNGEQFSFKVYESMSRYKKMQMYSIFKDKMLDLKCHLYMLKSINSKKGNAD